MMKAVAQWLVHAATVQNSAYRLAFLYPHTQLHKQINFYRNKKGLPN